MASHSLISLFFSRLRSACFSLLCVTSLLSLPGLINLRSLLCLPSSLSFVTYCLLPLLSLRRFLRTGGGGHTRGRDRASARVGVTRAALGWTEFWGGVFVVCLVSIVTRTSLLVTLHLVPCHACMRSPERPSQNPQRSLLKFYREAFSQSSERPSHTPQRGPLTLLGEAFSNSSERPSHIPQRGLLTLLREALSHSSEGAFSKPPPPEQRQSSRISTSTPRDAGKFESFLGPCFAPGFGRHFGRRPNFANNICGLIFKPQCGPKGGKNGT